MKRISLLALIVLVAVFAVAVGSGTCFAAPPIQEPVDVNVLNFPPAPETVDVNVLSFPQQQLSPFARSCTASGDTCEIDLTSLTEMGEVHISQASGQAQNVGVTASPRFFNGGFSAVEVLLPPTVNTVDTGNDRDVVFSQAMDLIPVDTLVTFHEPDSTNVYFYISGYVVESPEAGLSAATAREAEFLEEGSKSP